MDDNARRQRLIARALRYWTASREDAEDLAQRVLVDLWRRPWDGRGTEAGWVNYVFAREAKNMLTVAGRRRRALHEVSLNALMDEMDADGERRAQWERAAPDDVARDVLDRDTVHRLLASLPARRREAVERMMAGDTQLQIGRTGFASLRNAMPFIRRHVRRFLAAERG